MTTEGTPYNRRILVIDDNAAIHDDFRKILCDDGSEATLKDCLERYRMIVEQKPLARMSEKA